jgi:hypothetical protein
LTLWTLYACKQTRHVDTDAGNSSERLRVLTDTIEAGAGHGSVLGLDQLEVRFVLLHWTRIGILLPPMAFASSLRLNTRASASSRRHADVMLPKLVDS